MNLYEAIFVRKTIRKYKMDKLNQGLLDNVFHFIDSLSSLFPDITVEYKLIEYTELKKYFTGAVTVKAPYYLSIYSKKDDGYQMNAGYLMQQISLYLTAKGIGSCYLGTLKAKKIPVEEPGFEYVITLGFGDAENEVYRTWEKAKRLPMDDIAIYKSEVNKSVKAMIQAARLAPSSMNSQPWRLVVYDNRIHVFCKKNIFLTGVLKEMKLIDIGMCLAHLLVTAEELWVDVKPVKLDNISSQAFKKNDYVISIKMC